MLRVPGHNPSSSSVGNDDEQITDWHAKRFSNATDTSQDAPSIATTTASGYARRAADDANRDTLLAFWEAEQRQRRDIAPSGSPSPSQQRHSWASNRSAARVSSERRNMSAYRPVAGRWTSQIEDPDTIGLAQTTDERVESRLAPYDDRPVDVPHTDPDARTPLQNTAPAQPLSGADVVKELHRKSLTPTPLETVQEHSMDEQALHLDSSPTRSYRKPVPEHDFRDENGAPAPSPQSPARRSFLPSHRRSATTESSGAASKRASEQSHLSAATGALHQHVERLRAGPQYHKDENALHLLQAMPEVQPSTSSVALRSTTSNTIDQTIVGQPAPTSPQRRGRAWSLSLINKLKSRTRKSSDSSSLLSARVPSFSRLDAPSLLTIRPAPSSETRDGSFSPLADMRRERESAQQQQQSGTPPSPLKDQQPPGSLYQLARRPLRKAAPTTASSDADVLTARAPSDLVTAAVHSPTMQRTFSASSQVKQRPASIASRRSSRSRRDSDDSIRRLAKAKKEGDVLSNESDKGTPGKAKKAVGATSPSSTAWWNPWSSRKNSSAGMADLAADENSEWVDEQENAAGIHAPVAEDPCKPSASSSNDRLAIIDNVATLDTAYIRRKSANGETDTFYMANTQPNPPLTASSSFSSLAPTPAPALVPPPRPNRRGKRTDSGSRRGSSTSSPTSPALLNDEARFASSDASSNAAPIPASSNLLQAPTVPRTTTLSSSPRGSSVGGTEARESLLSDDLDYITMDNVQSDSDVLEEAATMHGYRASLPEARRSRGVAPHLSPVREMMTPDSRVLSDDRSGALSAASTVDQRAHRRISSGATMGRFLVPSTGTTSLDVHERRPIPAPSVVAEPHATLSSVHRAESVSSSFDASTIAGGGGGGIGEVDVSSKNKLSDTIAVVNSKRARQEAAALHRRDSRSRSTSMPTKPRSQLSSSKEPATGLISPEAQDIAPQRLVRESWRSSVDGPWDGRVVSLAEVVQLPAVRGLGRPSTATLPRQRSRSQPLDAMQDDTIAAEDYLQEPADAVPFAETAVQASLAALQALEMKEEAEKDGDWRARWASEKLLGFSVSSQPGASLLGSRWRDGKTAVRTTRNVGRQTDVRSRSSSIELMRQADRSLPQQDISIEGLPPSSNRVISAAEWDETVVPAHAKLEKAIAKDQPTYDGGSVGLMASGMVAPGSPDNVEFPTTMTTINDAERESVIDHGSPYSSNSRRKYKEKSSAHRRREGSDRGDPSRSHRRRKRRGHEERHDRYPTSSTAASMAKSTHKSRIVRRGYGCEDIVAWQSSLSIAALPSVQES